MSKENSNIPPFRIKLSPEELAGLVELEGGKTEEEWEELGLKYLIEGQYDRVEKFRESRAVVEKNNQWYFIKEDGTELSSDRYDYANGFYEGRAWVNKGNEFWFIKEDGTELSSERYDDVTDFEAGQAKVRKDDEEFYIDLNGNRIP